MPKTKTQKGEIVRNISELVKNQNAMVFVDVKGMTVKELSLLRGQLKTVGGKLQVMKKTLFRRALAERGVLMDVKNIAGQIAAVFALKDPVDPMKSITLFAKTHEKLKLIGGFFENVTRGQEEIRRIAMLPSRQELLGTLVGTIAAPLSGLANALQGNIKGLVMVLRAKSDAK